MNSHISASGRGSVAAGSITGNVSTGGHTPAGEMRTFREWLDAQPFGRSIGSNTRGFMEKAWNGALAESCEFGCMPMDHGEPDGD